MKLLAIIRGFFKQFFLLFGAMMLRKCWSFLNFEEINPTTQKKK